MSLATVYIARLSIGGALFDALGAGCWLQWLVFKYEDDNVTERMVSAI